MLYIWSDWYPDYDERLAAMANDIATSIRAAGYLSLI